MGVLHEIKVERMEFSERFTPHKGPQTAFLNSKAHIAVYGGQAGGGKTWALLVEAARHVDVPGYGAVIFRRTSPQITNEGGLWDESMGLYPKLGGVPRHTLDWQFRRKDGELKDAANIGFRHLQHEKDKLTWQGSQIAMLGFDELTHFTESQFFYLLSRNRSTCGVTPYVRATTNPVPSDDPIGGWVNRMISWWIDQETGLAIPERSGIVRWFIRRQRDLIWSDSKEALIEKYGRPDLDIHHVDQPVLPKSFTFIPARLSDNPTLLQIDPSYRANLLALPDVERERLAEGNWNAKVQAGLFFKIGRLTTITTIPASLEYCRAWDLAATDGAGDWTVGAKLGRDASGVYYIVDIQRGQWETGYRDEVIRATTELDGNCVIRVPQDPGAAGKSEAHRLGTMLAGRIVKKSRVTGDKATRAAGFASQVNIGNVRIFNGWWATGLTQRLDAFPTRGVPDDEIDALADAFYELATKKALVIGTGDHSE
jgi:predicted phage terminase large subunit-like protein